ncbi:MAG: CoA-binding protein, partial [Candidatus Odinarchaeota archaeon]|nr:CoA-binding protein [Candidatus Odinarchaeota archaeon]
VSSEMYRVAADILLSSDRFDGLILLALHHPPGIDAKFADNLIEVVKKYDKPVTMCDIGSQSYSIYIRKKFDEAMIPSYPTPERAVRAMAALVEYGLYLKRKGFIDDYIKEFKKFKEKIFKIREERVS